MEQKDNTELDLNDKMLEIDEGPNMPQISSKESKKNLSDNQSEAGNNQILEEKKGDSEDSKKKKLISQEKVYQVMKALTALKLAKEDSVPAKVFPDIFLGSVGAAYNKKVLKEIGITHILTCAANIKPRYPDDFKYEILNCLDSPNQSILQYVDIAIKFINDAIQNNSADQQQNKVLVHCFAGKSRATSFLLSYMIKQRKISLKESLDQIWKVRSQAAPNPGFMIQLKALEKNVLGECSDCEVMQGMWKEKFDAIKMKKTEQSKGDSDKKSQEDLLNQDDLNVNQFQTNEQKQILEDLKDQMSKLSDDQASNIKELKDAQQILNPSV